MGKNQLFKQIPTRDLCIKVLNCFGLQNFDDTSCFSRKDLETIKTVDAMNKLKPELYRYYLPCKARTYLNDLTTKNVITVLRQLVRIMGYSVYSREKYIRGEKFIIYNLMTREKGIYRPIQIQNNSSTRSKLTVTFD